ncbi:hypothetical protein U1Q18_005267 [Sarracenia purpurea var. burkii]
MQCTSLKSGHGPFMHESLSGCYSIKDLIVGSNGSIYNNERNLKNGNSHGVSLIYDKEILKQIMLKHESIFRDQVHELHRLYRKQRELMDEIRRELSVQTLQLQTSQPNSFLSKISLESAKRTWEIAGLPLVNPAANRPSISSAENFQSISSISEDNLVHFKMLHSKCEKRKEKMLDLELPADEYIDSEEEEKVSKVTEMPCHPRKRTPDVSQRTNDLADLNEPIRHEDEVVSNSVKFLGYTTDHKRIPWHLPCSEEAGQRVNPISQVSSSGKLPMPFDQLKVELSSELSSFNLLGECARKLQNQGTYSFRETLERNYDISNDDYRGLASYCLPTSYQIVPQSNLAKSEPPSFVSQRKPNARQNPIAIQALPCFNLALPSSKSTKSVNSVKSVDLNMLPSCSLDPEVFQQGIGTEDGVKKHDESQAELPGSRQMPDFYDKPSEEKREDFSLENLVISQAFPTSVCDDEPKRFTTGDDLSVGTIVDSTISGVGNQIDLNCCINEDESSPTISNPSFVVKTKGEIDLDAPVSPENKESSPPRGESEESQLETPIIDLSKQEDSGQNDELVRMAAEAIVLISIPGYQKLHWFAGIVSSLVDDLENDEVGTVLSGKIGGDQQELSSDGSDYFEAMTLKLTETKVEDSFCEIDSRKEEEEEICSVSSPSQPRKGPPRRGRQRKDFQVEVLPSLASLSRHEVTEDLQTIGELMEASGFEEEASPGRRKMGRNACSRARRSRNSLFRHGMETSVCSPSKKQQKKQKNDNDFILGEKSLKGWGKINRRRRGPRIPACNPLLIFS